jgi:hypothetical protein
MKKCNARSRDTPDICVEERRTFTNKLGNASVVYLFFYANDSSDVRTASVLC